MEKRSQTLLRRWRPRRTALHFSTDHMRLTSLFKKLLRWELALFLVSGCLTLVQASDKNFFVMDGHQSTIFVEGPVARAQNVVFYVTCWVTLVIFVIVGGVMGWVTLKFKARSEADEHAEPPAQSHGNPLVEIGLIAASVLALVVIAIPTVKEIWYTHDVPGADSRAKLEMYASGGQLPAGQARLVGELGSGGTEADGTN